MDKTYDLGRLVGRREAFSAVAGRCSAADAASLREVRDKKLYEGQAKDWGECCSRILHISKTHANRMIRYLEEFGPRYFEVAQLTRISPQAYRAIAPAIQDQALHHNGEAIALIPENAERVAAAVAEIRKAAQPEETPAPTADSVPEIEESCSEILRRIEAAIGKRDQPSQIRAVIAWMRGRLDHLELTV